jgi:hypothetical protein
LQFEQCCEDSDEMFAYSAYNLRIHSELEFPELVTAPEPPYREECLPDVRIACRQISDSEVETANGESRFLGLLDVGNVGRFLVEFGRSIVVEPASGIGEDILRPCILGPIFAVLLRQRGLLVLHASSVAIDGEAIGFLGHSGWGKSTLATAFYNQGYSLLTDDVMAIQLGEDNPITLPGYPHVRLLPDSATSLGYDFEALAPIHDGAPKRNNFLIRGFQQSSLLIKKIYVLENIERSCNEIQLLYPQAALVELIRHSRVTNLLQSKNSVSLHLNQCTELIKKVPICQLKRRRSLSSISDLVKLIEEDVVKKTDTVLPIVANSAF